MSLKNLLFPLVAIISVFLLFTFIKPAVSGLFGHVEEKKAKLADLDAVERTAANIGAISKEYLMFSNDGTLDRVVRQLPESSGQDRIVGMVHRAAEQSGVIVSTLSFEEKEPLRQDSVFVADPAAEMLPIAPIPPTLSDPKLFSATVKADGSYEGIKSFFGMLSGMEQINRVSAFSVEHAAPSPGEENSQPGVLVGSLSIDFLYLPSSLSEYANGYLLPVFSGNNFDMSAAEASLKMAESTDVIAPAISGRPNPFLP